MIISHPPTFPPLYYNHPYTHQKSLYPTLASFYTILWIYPNHD